MALKGMPAPVPDLDTQPFWDGLCKDRLLLPHCASCGEPRWPPGPMCPYCSGLDTQWRDAPATATLYSWEVVHHATHPALKDQVPYVIAIAQFTDKVRLVGNIVNWDGRDLCDGVELKVTFETREEDGVRIYNFLL